MDGNQLNRSLSPHSRDGPTLQPTLGISGVLRGYLKDANREDAESFQWQGAEFLPVALLQIAEAQFSTAAEALDNDQSISWLQASIR